MTNQFPRIKNFNVSVKEINNKILFMRKLVEGGSEHSFGIHVAKLAGMPEIIINRANEVLSNLESKTKSQIESNNVKSNQTGAQLSFFQLEDPVLEQLKNEIKGLDINNLTPIEALMKLNEIKKHVVD